MLPSSLLFIRCVEEWSELHDSILKRLELVPSSQHDDETMLSMSESSKKILTSETRFGSISMIKSLENVLNDMYDILRSTKDAELHKRMNDIVVMIESDFQFKNHAIREICEKDETLSKTRALTMYRQKSFLNPLIVEPAMRFIRHHAAKD